MLQCALGVHVKTVQFPSFSKNGNPATKTAFPSVDDSGCLNGKNNVTACSFMGS